MTAVRTRRRRETVLQRVQTIIVNTNISIRQPLCCQVAGTAMTGINPQKNSFLRAARTMFIVTLHQEALNLMVF